MDNKGPNGQANAGAEGNIPSIGLRPQGQKGRKARGQKTTGAQGKRPLKLSLDVEIHERLAIHALRRNQTISEVVTDLATKHLNDWILHAKPGPRSEAS
jgi:hypothetical protein